MRGARIVHEKSRAQNQVPKYKPGGGSVISYAALELWLWLIIIFIPSLIQFDIVKHMRQDQITNGLVHAISSVRTPYLLLLF